jgi:hypothetical protein
MTSRATGMRPTPKLRSAAGLLRQQRFQQMKRDFPLVNKFGDIKAVCRRCGLVINDCEPMDSRAEFFHGAKPHQTRALACPNDLKTFYAESPEIEPFMRKSRRRALKRAGIRA